MLAGAFISLSNLFKDASIYADPIDPLPIYVPVLVSCLLPLIFSFFGMFTKYVFGTKKISPDDFTFGYFLIFKGFFAVMSIWYFMNYPIDWHLYMLGFLGSLMDLTGCYFANSAVALGKPCGPIFALCDSQWIVVTLLVAVFGGIIPHWMQMIGLVFGGIGFLILSMYEYFQEMRAAKAK